MMNGKIHKYLIFDILLIKYALWLSTSIASNCSYVHVFFMLYFSVQLLVIGAQNTLILILHKINFQVYLINNTVYIIKLIA